MRRLDQFWNFPNIENEHTFSTFASFKKDYFMPFLVAWQKCSVDKKLAADDAEMKAKGKKMNNNTLKWIKAHFDELQFFGPESYIIDGSEIDEKYAGATFCPNFAFVKYEGVQPCECLGAAASAPALLVSPRPLPPSRSLGLTGPIPLSLPVPSYSLVLPPCAPPQTSTLLRIRSGPALSEGKT